jgi:hypothetical protein
MVPNHKFTMLKNLHHAQLNCEFHKNLCIFKKFTKNLVDERGNMPRRGIAPRFYDLEVIALCLTTEKFSVDSESY